jgi:hypothetical protein
VAVLVAVGCGTEDAPVDEVPPPDKAAPVARVSTTDAWIDLIAQRPSAVLRRNGRVVVDLGRETARKHVQLAVNSPWILGQEVDGREAALVLGRGGTIDIPLDGALSPSLHPDRDMGPEEPPRPQLALAITMRGLAPKQLVSVMWNERRIVNLRVAQEWQRRTISIPSELARPGENSVRLHFRHIGQHREHQTAAAIESIEVGTRDAIVEGPVDLVGYSVEPKTSGGVSLMVNADTGLVFYTVPPRRAKLRFDVKGKGSLRVLASVDADHSAGRQPAELHQEPLRETGSHAEVDLAGYAGEPTRIEVEVTGSTDRASATFSALEVSARRNVSIDRRAREPRNLYVLALEGARPDELLDPLKRPTLDTIAKFASEAMVFDRAYALGAAAVPSHAGLLSSVVPPVHLTVRGTYVAEGQTLLPEVLERVGYFTIGASANTDVREDRGLVQGIDDHRIIKKSPTQRNNANGIVDQLISQLEIRPEPRFAYLTMSDPQAPYDPPLEVLGELVPPEDAPRQHLTHMWVGRVRMGKVEPDAEQLRYVRRLYRGELQVVDEALGRLMGKLEELGEAERSIVVVVGIHGEEFYEHLGAGHGRVLFEESIHVPLMIRAPGLLEPGRTDAPVDLLDLAPTLADLLGVEYPDAWQGRTLVPLIDDPQPSPRLVVSHLGDGSRAGIVGHYKLILGPGTGAGARRLFDIGAEGGEQPGQELEPGIAFRIVRTALAWHLAAELRWKRSRWGTGAALEPAFALDHGM